MAVCPFDWPPLITVVDQIHGNSGAYTPRLSVILVEKQGTPVEFTMFNGEPTKQKWILRVEDKLAHTPLVGTSECCGGRGGVQGTILGFGARQSCQVLLESEVSIEESYTLRTNTTRRSHCRCLGEIARNIPVCQCNTEKVPISFRKRVT